jgi:hypothetical protein
MQPSWWIKIRNDYIALVDDRCLLHHGMNFIRKHLDDFPDEIRRAVQRVDAGLYFAMGEQESAELNLARWIYDRLKADERDERMWGERKNLMVDASRIRC